MAFQFLTFHASFRERVIAITLLKFKCQMENVQGQLTAMIKPTSSIPAT